MPIQPANTMEMTLYVNDISEQTEGNGLNLFQNIFMQNRIFYAHVYDYTREMNLDKAITVEAKNLGAFYYLTKDQAQR